MVLIENICLRNIKIAHTKRKQTHTHVYCTQNSWKEKKLQQKKTYNNWIVAVMKIGNNRFYCHSELFLYIHIRGGEREGADMFVTAFPFTLLRWTLIMQMLWVGKWWESMFWLEYKGGKYSYFFSFIGENGSWSHYKCKLMSMKIFMLTHVSLAIIYKFKRDSLKNA